jgi:hypothetical protein
LNSSHQKARRKGHRPQPAPARGVARPLVRRRKPNAFRFKDDGCIANNPNWPLVVYRGAVRLPREYDPAAAFEDLFEQNGGGRLLGIWKSRR